MNGTLVGRQLGRTIVDGLESFLLEIFGAAQGNGTRPVVPLSHQAVEALRQLQTMKEKGFGYPGRTPAIPMSNDTILYALYRLGYHGRMTGHGFRALASTTLNEMGYRPDVIERQLVYTEKMPSQSVS